MHAMQFVQIPLGQSLKLEGVLTVPGDTQALVIFAHGSGSSRHSPRNKFVAQVLHQAGVGTLLFDLLTSREDDFFDNRFNMDLLTDRLVAVTSWLRQQPDFQQFPIGYFGASTGTAAALRAAAELGPLINAVVSRGGRPDLAEQALPRVQAPVLLIVGGNDEAVITLNRRAFALLTTQKDLAIVPNATHLFEEPGALNRVARLASDWFTRYLPSAIKAVPKRAS